jgi:hypothetical protein
MNEAIRDGSMHMSDAIDVTSLTMTTLEPR